MQALQIINNNTSSKKQCRKTIISSQVCSSCLITTKRRKPTPNKEHGSKYSLAIFTCAFIRDHTQKMAKPSFIALRSRYRVLCLWVKYQIICDGSIPCSLCLQFLSSLFLELSLLKWKLHLALIQLELEVSYRIMNVT